MRAIKFGGFTPPANPQCVSLWCCRLFCYVLLAVLGASFLPGQGASGEIAGNVFGPERVAVPEAAVTVTDWVSKAVKTARSSATGSYSIPQLSAGTYVLTTTAAGFQPFKQNVYVSTSGKFRVDVHLSRDEEVRQPGHKQTPRAQKD